MPKVVTFSPGDVVRPMAQWDDPDFGTVSASEGGGLLALNPDRPPKYAICFLNVQDWEDISECYWIPIPDHIDVILSQKNAASPDNLGAIKLRGQLKGWKAFGEKLESTIPFVDLTKPDTFKVKGDRLKWGKTGDAYKLTPEGEQHVSEYWDDKERGPIIGPRESGYRTSPFRDLSRKTQVTKQQALKWYSEPKTLREIVSTIGEDEFYDQKSKGYWQLVTDLAVREDPEEELTERKKRVLGIPGLGKVGEAFTPFVQGAGIAAGAGASIGASTGKQFGKGFLRGARIAGRAQMNRFADTKLGQHYGVQKRKQTMLRFVPVGQGVVFINPIPDLGIEKNQMGIVERGTRGGEKTVRFVDTGEQVIPQQGTWVMQVPPSELPTIKTSGLVGRTPFDIPSEMSYRSGKLDYGDLSAQEMRRLGLLTGYSSGGFQDDDININQYDLRMHGDHIKIHPDNMTRNYWENAMKGDEKRNYVKFYGEYLDPKRAARGVEIGLGGQAVLAWIGGMSMGPIVKKGSTLSELRKIASYSKRQDQIISLEEGSVPKQPRAKVGISIVQDQGRNKIQVSIPAGLIPSTAQAPGGYKPWVSEARLFSVQDLAKHIKTIRGSGINTDDRENWIFVDPSGAMEEEAKTDLADLLSESTLFAVEQGFGPVILDDTTAVADPTPAAAAAGIEDIEINPPSQEEKKKSMEEILEQEYAW